MDGITTVPTSRLSQTSVIVYVGNLLSEPCTSGFTRYTRYQHYNIKCQPEGVTYEITSNLKFCSVIFLVIYVQNDDNKRVKINKSFKKCNQIKFVSNWGKIFFKKL